MKYIFLTLLGLIAFSPSAKAELTKTDLQTFNTNYVRVYKTCDFNKISAFLNANYAPDYVAQIQLPNGQLRKINKPQFLNMTKQGVQTMKQINGATSNCTPDMSILDIKTNGNQGTMQIVQREQMTLPTPQGEAVQIRMNTTCKHAMKKQNDKVMVMQSACLVEQK